jgi:uncharacterized membrane protein
MGVAQTYLRAAGLGAVTGLRSMTAVAALSRSAGGPAATLVPLLALGELVVDKLPQTPNRTAPGALAFRAVMGGVAGALVCGPKADRRIGFALGAGAAVAAAFVGLRVRLAVDAADGLPDPVAGLVEDALAVGAGLLLTTSSTPSTSPCAK